MNKPSNPGRNLPDEDAANSLGFPSPVNMIERSPQGLPLHELWLFIVKRRTFVVASTAAGLAIALLISLLMVPQYRASATLEIGEEDVKVVDIGGQQAIPMADGQFMETQIALLRSRTLAERVARQLKLADNPDFANPDASAQARLDQATDKLNQSILVEPVSESRLVRVGFESSDAALAASVANSVATSFIESALERRYQANDYAREFLQRRIDEVRGRLEESERKLVLYAQAQNIVSVGGQAENESSEGLAGESLQAASLATANSELGAAQTARVAAEQRYFAARRSTATSELLESSAIQAIKTQQAQLRAEYAQKRAELKPDHPEMLELQSAIDALQREINRERGATISALEADYRAAAAREQELRGRVQSLTSDVLGLRGKTINYNILQRDVDTNRQLYDALLQRFKEVGVSGGIGKNLISVVDTAKRPGAPFTPDIPRNLVIGALLGLLGGIGLAIGSGLLMNKIKVPADLNDRLSLPSLGVIPLERQHAIETALATPKSALFEAYASLRSQILFSTKHMNVRSLLITSSGAGEGKTTTSLALAQNFARMGKSTLLVDADLRHPSFIAPARTPGFAELLAGECQIDGAVFSTEVENLSLLAAGDAPANPVDLLANGQLADVMRHLQGRFDLVVVDGPPVLGLADAPLLSSAVDRTIVVFHADAVRAPVARNAVDRLKAANARIMGGVLTMFDDTVGGYAYDYDYSYGQDRADKSLIRINPIGGSDEKYAAKGPVDDDHTSRPAPVDNRPWSKIGAAASRAARVVFWFAVAFAMWAATVSGGFGFWEMADKMQHAITFLAITSLAIVGYPRVPLWTIWAGLSAFGGAIELIQMIPALGRDANLMDFIADVAAISCAVAFAWLARSTIGTGHHTARN